MLTSPWHPRSVWPRIVLFQEGTSRRLVCPIARFQIDLVQLGLARSGFGVVVVFPADARRQRHQDRFGASGRFQTEDGTAVVEQIEFDVSSPAVFLKGPLLLRIRFVFASLDDGQICLQKMVAAIAYKLEQGLEVAFEVIEEDATDAAGLAAVRQEEILITPFLHLSIIHQRLVFSADALPDLVKVDDVLAVGIIRGQVGTAAEPLALALAEIAEIGVDGRYHRTAGMQYQGEAAGGEFAAFTGHLRRELFGQLPMHIGEVDAAFLEDGALANDARPPTAAARTPPGILLETRPTVKLFQRGDNTILQLLEITRSAAVHRLARHDGSSQQQRATYPPLYKPVLGAIGPQNGYNKQQPPGRLR